MLILLILKLWPTSAVGGGVSKSCQSYFLLIFLSSTSSIAAVVAAGEEKTHWFGLACFFCFRKKYANNNSNGSNRINKKKFERKT